MNLEDEYSPPLVAGVTQPKTFFTYNLDKQPTLITRPDGQTIAFNYEPSTGRLGNFVIPRGTTSFSYNATTGNLDSITAPGAEGLAFTYDGSLPLSTTWSGTVAGSVSRTYDNNFRITSRSVNGGNTIAFTYDNDDLLTAAGAESLTNDPANGLLSKKGSSL